MESTKTEDT